MMYSVKKLFINALRLYIAGHGLTGSFVKEHVAKVREVMTQHVATQIN